MKNANEVTAKLKLKAISSTNRVSSALSPIGNLTPPQRLTREERLARRHQRNQSVGNVKTMLAICEEVSEEAEENQTPVQKQWGISLEDRARMEHDRKVAELDVKIKASQANFNQAKPLDTISEESEESIASFGAI